MSIGDPAAGPMEEDRAANLLLASELAPRLCRGCQRYHLRYVARRAVQGIANDSIDRPVIVRLLGRLIETRARRVPGTIEVVIAGASDTGTLASAATAAFRGGELDRCRFTVLDLCPTPLALCEAYGREKELEVATRAEDLAADAMPHPADFVVVHSLFRHVPAERHVPLLQRFAAWLRPGGRILFSVLIEPPGGPRPSSAGAITELRAMLKAGLLRVAEPVDAFMERVGEDAPRPEKDHAAELPDTAAILALFSAAGLRVETAEEVESPWGMAGVSGSRKRMFAVLGAD
jgi:SAM-dependent methyltransferase